MMSSILIAEIWKVFIQTAIKLFCMDVDNHESYFTFFTSFSVVMGYPDNFQLLWDTQIIFSCYGIPR